MFLSIAARLSNKCVFIWFGHTNATLLINNGTNIKAVQGLLGHSTAVTTMNIYAHEIQAAEAAASAALGEIIENDLIKKAE